MSDAELVEAARRAVVALGEAREAFAAELRRLADTLGTLEGPADPRARSGRARPSRPR